MTEKNDDEAVGYKRPHNEGVALPDGKPRTSTNKKGKSKSPAKWKRAVPAKPKSVVQGHDAALEPIRGRWIQSIEPPEIAVIARQIWWLFVVIGNRGPSTVLVSTGRAEEKITPNTLRVMSIQGELTIESMDGKCATVDLEFIPRAK